MRHGWLSRTASVTGRGSTWITALPARSRSRSCSTGRASRTARPPATSSFPRGQQPEPDHDPVQRVDPAHRERRRMHHRHQGRQQLQDRRLAQPQRLHPRRLLRARGGDQPPRVNRRRPRRCARAAARPTRRRLSARRVPGPLAREALTIPGHRRPGTRHRDRSTRRRGAGGPTSRWRGSRLRSRAAPRRPRRRSRRGRAPGPSAI